MFLGSAHNLALGFKFPILWKRKWKSVEVLLFTLVHDVTLYQPLLIIIIWTFFVVFFFLFFFFKCLCWLGCMIALEVWFPPVAGEEEKPFLLFLFPVLRNLFTCKVLLDFFFFNICYIISSPCRSNHPFQFPIWSLSSTDFVLSSRFIFDLVVN